MGGDGEGRLCSVVVGADLLMSSALRARNCPGANRRDDNPLPLVGGQDVFEHDVDHFRRKDREEGGHYLENEECNPIRGKIIVV